MQFVYGLLTGIVVTGIVWSFFHVQLTAKLQTLEAEVKSYAKRL